MDISIISYQNIERFSIVFSITFRYNSKYRNFDNLQKGVLSVGIGERIAQKMRDRGLSQNRLARAAQISQSGLSSIISGAVSPKENTLQAIAAALGCTVAELVSGSDVVPVRPFAVPIVGEIACGVPITAQQNIEGYADIPEGVHADFALRCKGDSMTPTFIDGDLVLIRQQADVEPGQIAAIQIDGEATLKHVYRQDNGLLLTADNPKFPPLFVPFGSEREIIVHGRVIGYTRLFD